MLTLRVPCIADCLMGFTRPTTKEEDRIVLAAVLKTLKREFQRRGTVTHTSCPPVIPNMDATGAKGSEELWGHKRY